MNHYRKRTRPMGPRCQDCGVELQGARRSFTACCAPCAQRGAEAKRYREHYKVVDLV